MKCKKVLCKKVAWDYGNPDLSMEVCEDPLLRGVDEVLHPVLEPEPLEVDGDQLVGRHHGSHAALELYLSLSL